MTSTNLRILYLGTPDFAVEPLRRLVEGHYNIVAVVTTPDRPVGRHHDTLQPSPVKTYALQHDLPLLQPQSLRDPDFLEQVRVLRPDVGVVVAFRILPAQLYTIPRHGTFNLHAALLPQYRGAAPINWAIINGERQTGITTFLLDDGIDTGRIIAQDTVPIHHDDNAGDLHDRLMHLGASLVTRTIDQLAAGTIHTIPQDTLQDNIQLHPAPKIYTPGCQIQWHQHTVHTAHDFIRGLSPHPGAWTTLPDGRTLKIYKTVKHPDTNTATTMQPMPQLTPASDQQNPLNHQPGESLNSSPLFIHNDTLIANLPGGHLQLIEVQLAGKRRMTAPELLRGLPANTLPIL